MLELPYQHRVAKAVLPALGVDETRYCEYDSATTKGALMSVLMIGEVPNLTEEIYGGMIGQMMPLMRASKGFISHAGGPSPAGGWRVVEVWESEEDGQTWFDENVKPNLPPDIVPDRRYYPLHTAFTK